MNLVNNELEKQYTNIKKKLEHFQYNQPLGSESVALADKLLSDLLKTTKGFQEMKTERDKLKEQLESERQVPLALRNENAKLLKENNELHRELIKLKEDIDFKALTLEQTIKKLETEKEEVRFLLSQKDIHIKSKENESESLRRKLNDLLNKMYSTNDTTHSSTYSVNPKLGLPNAEKLLKNNKTMNLIGRKNEIDMTKGLDHNSQYHGLISDKKNLIQELNSLKSTDKEEWAKDLHIADERAEKFRNEIRELNEAKTQFESRVHFLESQTRNRDQEIRRLQTNYLSSDNIEELKIRYQSDLMKMTVEKLNQQIDFLNKENQKLKDTVNFHNSRCREDEIRKLDKELISMKKERETLNKKFEGVEKNTNYTSSSGMNKSLKNATSPYDNNFESFKELKEENLTLLKEVENKKSLLSKLSEQSKLMTSDFNSERLALLKSLDTAKSDLIQNQSSVERLNKAKDSLQKQNEGLLTELNMLKGRELISNRNYENKTDNVSKICQEYQQLSEENKSLRRKIQDLEEKTTSILKENKEMNLERESINQVKQNAEKGSLTLEEENKRLKTQFEGLSKNLEKFETQMKVTDVRRKATEDENKNILRIIDDKTQTVRELENKSESYLRQLQEANDNYSTLQAEHKNLSDDFTELLTANKKLEEKIRNFEREYNESRYIKDKLSEYEEKEKTLKNDSRLLERENKALKNELRTLNDIISESKSEINLLKETNKVLQLDKQRLTERLEKDSVTLLSMEENNKYFTEVDKSLEDSKAKVLELNNKILALKTELEKTRSDKSLSEFEVKKKNIEINKLNEGVQRKEVEINALREENKNLLQENEKIKEEVLIKRINETNNLEVTEDLIQLRDNFDREKSKHEKAAFENKTLNEKILKLSQEKSHLENKMGQLTNLLNEADKMRAELLAKLQEELVKNKTTENELQILKERENSFEQELIKLREENQNLKHGITSIDQNFDHMNNELDNKTEENSKLNMLVNNLKEQNDELTKKLQQQFNKSNIDSKRLNERDSEIQELKSVLTAIQIESNEMKNALGERNKEVQDLNYDLRLLQNENQSLVEDLTHISKENEKLSLIKFQIEKNSEIVAQKYRSNELDLNELYSTYKETCKENERLKQNLKIFVDENKLAAGYIKQIESKLGNYENNITSSVQEKDSLVNKVDFLEKYNSELVNEIARLNEELNLRGDNERFLQDNVKIDKEINVNYENHIANLNRHIAKLESEKQSLIDNVNNLNNKMEFLSHSKSQTEDCVRKYEEIINEERRKLHSLNVSNQKLKEETNFLKEENKKTLKMINENRDIKELKNQILGSALVLDPVLNLHSTANTGRTPNFVLSSETFSTDDENGIMKRLVADLNSQIEELRRDLKSVREENTRLMSERSITKDNLFSSQRQDLSHSKSESVSSRSSNNGERY